MILSFDQLRQVIHNVLSVDELGDGTVMPRRYTEKQLADLALDGEGFPVRGQASANVTLDMITDADWIGMDFTLRPGSSQTYAAFDVFVDGVLTDTHTYEGYADKGFVSALPEGRHRVTVFLPWSMQTLLREVSLSDGAHLTAVPDKKMRILAIGDSVTQGYMAAHPGMTWVAKVTRDLDAEVLNYGIGGYRFLRNSLNEPITWNPDLIILSYGTNDYSILSTAEAYRMNVSAYLERLHEMFPTVPVLQCLPIYRRDERHIYREHARRYTLEDARNILREEAARYPQITLLEDRHYPRTADFYAPDYLHPNDIGFLVHGERVVQAIRDMGVGKGK